MKIAKEIAMIITSDSDGMAANAQIEEVATGS
jgi:hypothetical protein